MSQILPYETRSTVPFVLMTDTSLKARSNRRPLFPFCFDICTSCDQNPIAGRLHFRQQGPSSPSASTGGSTRSTPSAHCLASRATPLLQPMPSFTRESGGTLHVAVMGVNRIGKECTSAFRASAAADTAPPTPPLTSSWCSRPHIGPDECNHPEP